MRVGVRRPFSHFGAHKEEIPPSEFPVRRLQRKSPSEESFWRYCIRFGTRGVP